VGSLLLFFRSSSIHEAVVLGKRILTGAPGLSFTVNGIPWEGLIGLAAVVAVDLTKEPWSFSSWFASLKPGLACLLWSGLIAEILMLGAKTDVRFLYLQF
jgi:hypothetical protein